MLGSSHSQEYSVCRTPSTHTHTHIHKPCSTRLDRAGNRSGAECLAVCFSHLSTGLVVYFRSCSRLPLRRHHLSFVVIARSGLLLLVFLFASESYLISASGVARPIAPLFIPSTSTQSDAELGQDTPLRPDLACSAPTWDLLRP